jgi:hypothetical protein
MRAQVNSDDAAVFLVAGLRVLGIDARLTIDPLNGCRVSWSDGQVDVVSPVALSRSPSDPSVSFNEAPATGSSWGIRCHQSGCPEALELKRSSASPMQDDDYDALLPALDTAAVFLGWRVFQRVFWCPTHTVEKKLICEGCRMSCPGCVCAGGPRSVAVFGGLPSLLSSDP